VWSVCGFRLLSDAPTSVLNRWVREESERIADERTILLMATMALTLLVASGVALAVTKIGGPGPDTLRGINGVDNLFGNGGNDKLYGMRGRDNLLGGSGKDLVLGGGSRAMGGDKNLVGGSGDE